MAEQLAELNKGEGFSYSTTSKMFTGRYWTNNKPIYTKTFQFNSVVGAIANYNMDISIDECINIYGGLIMGDGATLVPLNRYFPNGNEYTSTWVRTKHAPGAPNSIGHQNSYPTSYPVKVTIEFTE